MSLIKNKINYILGKNFDFEIGFIICGTQKGGTTALDRYLRLHPEICMANKKEVHFFDSDKYIIDLWWDHNKDLYETKTPYMEIKK